MTWGRIVSLETVMNSSHVLIAVTIGLAVVVALLLGRWEIYGPSGNGVLIVGYKLDRWTGDVYYITPGGEEKLDK